MNKSYCILEIQKEVQKEVQPTISYQEEMRLREENTFVGELYEQYKVALILASEGDDK